ncbi:peptidylprolyl isomerase [Gluconobacter oxydans]|uniref:Parvulin-like PPIase n=1 Tax=Gluconobacter oxydans TaxID=442 RepID=A0AB34XFY5_GLUOY|nr:peptidylprolyl isomerase [Gluconobacter oxydans]KXV07684.1 peptidylprolyl isomerase [Gluconobacter oxydans]KXV12051.1 peptidylprolyl isomerase [Gluconobacter oxydans]KXV64526.1 peptidylprolyl isomerase [Gluconobacter oxydans]MCP1247857.1 peptidylprolyl isomerase [Gluconobacter oxydans]WKE48430.1 peptidylprolyl isomerase [Gluconobacter oxydans]
MSKTHCIASTALAALLAFSAALPATAAPHHKADPKAASKTAATKQDAPPAKPPEDQILAVINGQVLTQRDVDNRAKLFVLSTGLPISPEIMNRMRGQIIHQLIDERLKTQEILKLHINVEPDQIAGAISNIEQRNGMPKNALRDRLASDGVSLTTLIDQIRVQIGWMQVLREKLGEEGRITATQISQREQALQAEQGRPQYFMSEIFVPVADPRHDENELAFTKTIISQLREGAPFPIVAAQFSQAQSALDGGSMGWVQEDNLDPQVVNIVRQMPIGAISNPIQVAGGFVIATVQSKRVVGKQMGTLLDLRQAFFPFDAPLNPQNPTEQQRAALQKATTAVQTVHSCDAMEALNKSLGEKRPSNPGSQILERLMPQMKAVLEALPPNKVSRPLVSMDGIALLMVCNRQQKNLAQQSPSEIADQLMNERVEQASRQLQRDLQRRAIIEMRPAAKTAFN